MNGWYSPERRSTHGKLAVLAWAAQYANMTAEQAHALPLAGTTGTTAAPHLASLLSVKREQTALGRTAKKSVGLSSQGSFLTLRSHQAGAGRARS